MARACGGYGEVRADVPEWALGATWYQILPERFANGNPLNDPTGVGVVGLGWLDEWEGYTPQALEAAWFAGEGEPLRWPRHRGGGAGGAVHRRRYGGDLQGLVARLDHLQSLGVTAIYLCPIFESASHHGYDASDFRHIDRNLGHPGAPPPGEAPPAGETEDPATWTWTAADRYFIEVVIPEVHRRGIKIVLDGVWNHVGTEHWAFRDVVRRGRASPYADWFEARFAAPDREAGFAGGELIGWRAWDGPNGRLPRLAHTPDGDLAAPVKQHIFAVTRRWMDPDGDGDGRDGIDGWRLDVAPEIGRAFWRDWRALVKSLNPDAALYGELWFDGRDYFDGTAFDAQMNYPFAMAAVRWLRGDAGFGSRELGAALERVFAHDRETDLAQMNLLVSHDTARLATMLDGPAGEYDGAVRGPGREPSARAFELAALGAALQATYLGSPMIYYGEEWGMHGGDDPDCRKPLPWPDLGPTANAADAPRAATHAAFRGWLRLRQDPEVGPALRLGSVRHVETGDPDVFTFVRTLDAASVVVALNRGDSPRPWPMERGADSGVGVERIGPRSGVWRLMRGAP